MKNSIVKNSFFNIIYKILSVVYPLVTEAYIARVLSPAGVGKVLFAYNIANYFVLLAPLGLPTYGIKAIGAVQNDRFTRDRVYSELFTINAVSTLLSVIVYYVISIFIHLADLPLALVFSSLVIANVINVDWFYQGIEEYRFIAVRSFFIKLLCMILLFTFVKRPNDAIIYAWILSFATIGNYFPNIVHIRKIVTFQRKGLQIRRHVRPLLILLISTVATEIYTLLDSTMIGIIKGEQYLPYYTYASRLVRTVFSLLTAMSAVLLPRLSFYFKNKLIDKYEQLLSDGIQATLFLAVPATIGVYLYAPQIITIIFGEQYINSITTIRILCPLVIVFSIAFLNGHQVLISTNHEGDVLKATIPGAIVNFSLNMILIRVISYNGAAIASVVAEILVTTILLFNARKSVHISYNSQNIIKMVVACIPFIPINMFLNKIFDNKYLIFFLGVIFSMLAYVICSALLKNTILIRMYNMGLKRFKKKPLSE